MAFGLWLLAFCMVSAFTSGAQVAVCGQISAAKYFVKTVLEPQGIESELFPEFLPVARYREFQAVVFVEYLTIPKDSDLSGYWDAGENADLVRKYVSEGGKIVIVDRAFALQREVRPGMSAFSDLFGFSSLLAVPKVESAARSPIAENPIFSAPEWGKGVDCLTAPTVSPDTNLTVEKLLVGAGTNAKGDGMEVVPATMNQVDKGVVYWFQISPMRLRQAADRAEVSPASADLYEQALQRVFAGKTPSSSGPVKRDVVTPAVSNGWGTEPLGPTIPSGPVGPSLVKRTLPALLEEKVDGAEPFLRSAEDLKSCLLIVGSISPNPNSVPYRAASLLQDYFQQITGISVPLTSENKLQSIVAPDGSRQIAGPDGQPRQHLIWLGESQAARDNAVSAQDLVPGGYRISSTPDGLILVGNDAGDSGTYYAAVSLLERKLGVRWLWPGPLGTVLPVKDAFALPRYSEKDEPALRCRNIRSQPFIPTRSNLGLKWLNESEDAYKAKYSGVDTWSRVQRLGGDLKVVGGHAFPRWYQRYGSEHPDWFALQPDNTRIQIGGRERFCKSNDGLVEQVARDRLKYIAENPPGSIVPMAPNDGGAANFYCMCPECRKLDPVNGPPVEMMFGKGPNRTDRFFVKYVSLTDRLVHFWNQVAERVLAEKPDARFTTYAYHVYRDAPLGAPLNPAFSVGFVGLTYFDEGARAADRERWDRWAARSSSLYLRPNALLGGRDFPCNYTKEMSEDISHCYQTGMVGADFDCITHDWATRGLNYYALARLLWNPGLSPDAIMDDYCRAGFGPAAKPVRDYFDELAKSTREIALAMGPPKDAEKTREEEIGVAIMPTREKMERALTSSFNPARLDRMADLLASARKLAEQDETIKQRVDFLSAGLEYARLQAAAYSAQYAGADLKPPTQALLEFLRRTSTTTPLAINAAYLIYDQQARFRILN